MRGFKKVEAVFWPDCDKIEGAKLPKIHNLPNDVITSIYSYKEIGTWLIVWRPLSLLEKIKKFFRK